jgi:endonuclease YncB( thermonuclease family)
MIARLIPTLVLASLLSVAANAEELTGRASVIDGDTIEIRGERLRLEGIDAFESKQTCELKGKAWPCGQRAALALADKVGAKPLRCTWEKRDRYRRALATCYLGSENVNAWLVREGWALAFRRYSEAYVKDEDEARLAKRGAWVGVDDRAASG